MTKECVHSTCKLCYACAHNVPQTAPCSTILSCAAFFELQPICPDLGHGLFAVQCSDYICAHATHVLDCLSSEDTIVSISTSRRIDWLLSWPFKAFSLWTMLHERLTSSWIQPEACISLPSLIYEVFRLSGQSVKVGMTLYEHVRQVEVGSIWKTWVTRIKCNILICARIYRAHTSILS
jgi:hypothetical protein